jgi:hypothetical protein
LETTIAAVSVALKLRASCFPQFCYFAIARRETDMPFKSVVIRRSTHEPYEAGAALLAWLAYPFLPNDKNKDKDDNEGQRDKFMHVLCRWFIVRMAQDEKWARKLQEIRPIHFTDFADKEAISILQRGSKKLGERIAAANSIVIPLAAKQKRTRAGYKMFVNQLVYDVAEDLGWKGDSVGTIKTKIWKPSRPVLHLAVVFILMMSAQVEKGLEEQDKELWWKVIESFLREPDAPKTLITAAEGIRRELQNMARSPIRDDETIKFVLR